MKYWNLLLFATLITGLACCQTKSVKIIYETTHQDTITKLNKTQIYTLQKETENSDFNYSKLNDIDGIRMNSRNLKNLMPIFEPVNGHYKYFQFLSTFVGEAYNEDELPLFKEFHDILIVKTDNDNKIIDAYQYTLEWAEPPLQYDLFKSSIKNLVIKNNLNISQLKFLRTYSWSDDDKELKEYGIIKLRNLQ